MPGKGGAQRSRSVPKERASPVMQRAAPSANANSFALKPFSKVASQQGVFQKSAPRTASAGNSPYSKAANSDASLRLSSLDLDNMSSRGSSRGSARGDYNDYASTYGGEDKCKCQICTCGKHHCPKKHDPLPFDGSTTTGATFKGHHTGAFPERARAPVSLYANVKAPASHYTTTHNTTYLEHDIPSYTKPHEERMEKSMRPQRAAPRETFDHSTSHQNDFPWHDSGYATRAPSRSLTHTPFGGSNNMNFDTTYGNHFVGATPRPASPSYRPVSDYSYGEPRNFETTQKSHFDGARNGRPATPVQQPTNQYSYGSPRDFGTTNNYFHDGKQNPTCPAMHLPSRPPSARTGHTRYRVDLSTGTWG